MRTLRGFLNTALFVAMAATAQPSVANAQTSGERKVWVTSADGREQQGTLVSFTPDQVSLRQARGQVTAIPFREIRLIEAKDGVGDGARRGAIAGAVVYGTALLLIAADCEGCSGFGPFAFSAIVGGSLLGAGVGACLDATVTRREVMFSASAPGQRVSVTPVLSPKAAGVRVAFAWSKPSRRPVPLRLRR
jgi:hypothetical protein